jgi:hypothetical protein
LVIQINLIIIKYFIHQIFIKIHNFYKILKIKQYSLIIIHGKNKIKIKSLMKKIILLMKKIIKINLLMLILILIRMSIVIFKILNHQFY